MDYFDRTSHWYSEDGFWRQRRGALTQGAWGGHWLRGDNTCPAAELMRSVQDNLPPSALGDGADVEVRWPCEVQDAKDAGGWRCLWRWEQFKLDLDYDVSDIGATVARPAR